MSMIEIEKILAEKESKSAEDATFCKAFRYTLKQMLVTNAFASARLKEIAAMLKEESRQKGMTLIEIILVSALMMIMMGSIFAVVTGGVSMAHFNSSVAHLQSQTVRSFTLLSEVLGKCGWNNDGVTVFPEINTAGDEMQFRIPEDLDGNGYPFDQATGDVEWGEEVYTLRLDPDTRILSIYDSSDTIVRVLGTSISSVELLTIVEDDTLDPNEVKVSIQATGATPEGDVTRICAGSIFMKNSSENWEIPE